MYVGEFVTSHQFLILAAPILVLLTTVQLASPLFCLAFECLLAKHLNTFAEKNNLLSNLQFSFCKVFGAHDTLLTIANSAQKTLDSAYKVHIVGLDLSAALNA